MPHASSASTIAEARANLQETLHLLDQPTKWQTAGTLIEKAIKLLTNQGDSKAILAATFLEGVGPLVHPNTKRSPTKSERDIIESAKQSIRWAIEALIPRS